MRYPVAPSIDFVLHVCNGRDPSYRGLDRCMDIQQALFSLISKGHRLNSSSLLMLYGQDQTTVHWSEDSSRRHLSLDATEGEFVPTLMYPTYQGLNSLHLRSPGLDGHRHLSDGRVYEGLLGYPRIHSQTPLMGPSSLLEKPHISEDEIPEFHLSHGPDEYRFRNLFTFHEDAATSPTLTSTLPTRSVSTRHGSDPVSFALPSSILTSSRGPLWEETDNTGEESFINPSWPVRSTPSVGHDSMDSTASHSTSRGLMGPVDTSTMASTGDATEERRRAHSISFVPSAGLRRNQTSPLSMQARTPVLQARTPTLQARFPAAGSIGFCENNRNEYSLGRGSPSSHLDLGLGGSGSDFTLSGDPGMSSEFKLDEGFGLNRSYSSMEYYANNKTLRRHGAGGSVLNPNCAEFIPNSHHFQTQLDKSTQPDKSTQSDKPTQREKGSRDLLVLMEGRNDR